MNPKLCRPAGGKHKYNSRAAAMRAGVQRYGSAGNAYRCPACDRYHLTRRGVPKRDEQIEQLVEVLLGKDAG